MRERQLSDLFHRLKHLFPDSQELITVPPDKLAGEALLLLQKYKINQVPIVEGSQVLGVFSYRSFAAGVLEFKKKEHNPCGLTVEALSEDLEFARITDEVRSLIDEFDLNDAILVGSEEQLQGIVTTIDALRYFYKAASPYVMLREIELAIRELMRASLSQSDLEECISSCLGNFYAERSEDVPTDLVEMTFSNYVTILECGDFWPLFKAVFGGSYLRLKAKLEGIPGIRNNVFHFRRELTIEEYDGLKDCRDWLLKRIRKLEARQKENENA